MLPFRLHVLANLFADLVEAGELAQFLGEIVIQFGQIFLLDGLNLHGVDERLAGQALVGDVLGITHFKLALFSGIGAAQILGEFRHRVLATDFDQDFIHVYGLGLVVTVFWLSVHGSLSEVALGQRPSFDRRVGGMLFAHAVQRRFDFFVVHDDFGMFGAKF